MKVREVIKVIQKDGWFHIRTRGSHRHFKHPTKPGLVTVAGHPNIDGSHGNAAQYFRAGRIAGTFILCVTPS